MKDAHVADDTGTQCGNDPYLAQFDKVEEKGYPWNFELPGKGSFKADPEMVAGLKAGYDKLMEHGWLPWMSCQPQVNTCIPKFGEYCASSESSAAAYINTIIGARTNRESPINTVYCAYTGCLPKYGTHLDENRAAKCIVELDDEVRDNMQGAGDWAALGACLAEKAENRIMAVLNLPKKMGPTATKQIVSACSRHERPDHAPMGYTPRSPRRWKPPSKGKMPKNP
jgi:predicted aconitase